MAAVLTNPLRPVLLAAGRSSRLERTVVRLKLTRKMVDRFVAGEAEHAVEAAVIALLKSGRHVSVDYLGEDVTEAAQATATVEQYLSLLRTYGRLDVPAATGGRPLEVSIKLTALGQSLPRVGHQVARDNARTICAAAQTVGAWVTVDAEDHTTTDSTLAIVRELREEFSWLGTVLQAYLFRTEQDCRDLAGPGSRIRLCKGAYREPASVAYQKPREVTASYLRCLRLLMEGRGYPMVASHDPEIIRAAPDFARQSGRGRDDFEFQMLFGIRDDEQNRLVGEGRQVRVYVPFGDQWYGYFMRRLAERPANLVFFLRALAGR